MIPNERFLDPLMILFGAIIWENEKDKFEEMIESKLMDKDIKKSIEGIVLAMNKDSFVIGRYYDREESRIAEWNAEIEEARKKFGIECDMTEEEIAEIDKYPLD